MGNFAVSLKRLVEKVSLEVIYTPCDLDKISVEIAEVNRPGLFLAGYYDYFDKLRLQIMGLAEMNFLAGLTPEKRRERLDQLFRQQPPAVILCRNEELEPFPEMQELAKQHGVALLRSNETTCTLHPALAPYKCAVLPLSKKLGDKAMEIRNELSKYFMVDYDDTGSIGKRYRREDEIGTPYCITVDFDTVGDEAKGIVADNCVTVRDRDTMEQVRMPISELKSYIESKIEF